jgi:pSer/pThr/pTyr-binding forkhead associated (FHA) protein
VLADGQPLKTVAIDDRVRIGRQSDNEIVLPDAGVSRHHAEVVNEGGSFTVRDLGSTNGTILNGETVEEAELFDGDRITVGHTVIEFRRA